MLIKLDGERDGYIGSFKGYVKSFARNPKPELNEPGRCVMRTIEEQGWAVESMTLEAESTAISKINDLFTSRQELKDAFVKMNLKPFWDDVMGAESKFLVMQGTRTSAYAAKGIESPVEVGRLTRLQCTKLTSRINSFAEVSKKPEYNQIILKINPIVEEKVKQLEARTTPTRIPNNRTTSEN